MKVNLEVLSQLEFSLKINGGLTSPEEGYIDFPYAEQVFMVKRIREQKSKITMMQR